MLDTKSIVPEIPAVSLRKLMSSTDRLHSAAICQPVNPSDYPGWDSLVATHPQHSIFHSAAWADTLQDAYHFKPLYLTTPTTSGGISILPLMEVGSWLTGRRGISLPYTDECEPLTKDEASTRYLLEAAMKVGKLRGWRSMEWRGGHDLFPEVPASLSFYTHKLSLEPSKDRMFSRFESSVRRAVRKAEKCGVTVTISKTIEAVKIFYALQCKTRRKHGLPPQPFLFFYNVFKHILSKELGMIALASSEGRPIAASVFLQSGGNAVYKFGASDEAFHELRGPNLVMWEAIKWLADHGANVLHLGRTSLGNEGLRRFKLGWGAVEGKINYFKYDFRKKQFVTETDGSTGWYNRLFRILPSGLSRAAGAFLYRHCP